MTAHCQVLMSLPKPNVSLCQPRCGLFIFRAMKTSRPWLKKHFSLVQLSSVTQLCLTLCDPMDCSTPGLPVHHQLPEFTQT